MEKKKERIVWIDQLRSIAFFFVILGHVALPKEWQSLIYSFHMPLFFMISGLTINREKIIETPMKEYIIHQIKHLIIPYIWMSFLMFPLWYYAFHMLSHGTDLTIVQAFLGIFIGNNLIIGSPSNALWFLLVLFLADILFAVLLKLTKGNDVQLLGYMILCAIIGYCDRGKPQIWHFNIAFTSVMLMYIGNSFMIWYGKCGKEILNNMKNRKKVLLIFILLIVGYVSHHMNRRISMTANKFGESLPLFYLTALSFAAVITLVVMWLPKMKVITFVGQNTLLYVGIHIPILRVFEKSFPQILSQYKYSVAFAVILYFGIIPICMLFNKFAPYVCGKKLHRSTLIIKIGKILLISFGAAVPYAKVFKEVGLWYSGGIHLIIYILVLIGLSSVFVGVTEKYIPIIYLEDK